MVSVVKQPPVAIDLYAGVGGLSLGIKQAGFAVAAAVEADPLTARYYQYNHPGTKMFRTDVRPSIAGRLIKAMPKDRELALAVGGPPCQGFSWAGRHQANDRRNEEIARFAETILALLPMAFVMENVRGILSYGASELEAARLVLSKLYSVGEPQILSAADCGVPQARERMFLVGIRRDLGVVPRPVAATGGCCPTVAEAIMDLPAAAPGAESDARGILFATKPESEFAKEMRGQARAVGDHYGVPTWDERYCTNAVPPRHGSVVRRRFAKISPGQKDPVSRVQRLNPEGLSVTIRAGTSTEYGGRSAPRPIHPFEDRVLTTRECARLQSFPDWYLFHPTKWHGNQQVGNAVPPLVARAVGEHLRSTLQLDSAKLGEPRERQTALIAEDFDGAAWLRRAPTRPTDR